MGDGRHQTRPGGADDGAEVSALLRHGWKPGALCTAVIALRRHSLPSHQCAQRLLGTRRAAMISRGRSERRAETLPERLQTRDWTSVVAVFLALGTKATGRGAGWKIGAAAEDIRRAEGVPSPSPGRIDHRFESPAELPSEPFINYRNCECEFAFELAVDFPARDKPYTEADAAAGVEAMYPALELGDTVFLDSVWRQCLLRFVHGQRRRSRLRERDRGSGLGPMDLPNAAMDVYLNGYYVKSGKGGAAMGHPLTSLTWMLNWLRERGQQCRGRRVREHRYLHRPPLRPAGRHCPR